MFSVRLLCYGDEFLVSIAVGKERPVPLSFLLL
jgi:hypothetical protein